jgi:hypothetical protein
MTEITTLDDNLAEEQPSAQGYQLSVREVRDAGGQSRWLGTVLENVPDKPEVWGASRDEALQKLENALRGPRRYLDGSVRRV